jgi:hypothetical protein
VCQKTKDPISEWALKMYTNSISEEKEKEELQEELRKKKRN